MLTTMDEISKNVLHHETALGFRRRSEKGFWVSGLPKRRLKSEYADYTKEDVELLSTLHSALDDIKALFKRPEVKSYIVASVLAVTMADALFKRLGPSLWRGQNATTPAFIDPDYPLDYSIGANKERYTVWSDACGCRLSFYRLKQKFCEMVMSKAFRYTENQSRYINTKP